MSKYPNCEKMGLIINSASGPILNENRFFSQLSYNDFREYEDVSAYPIVKISEVEKFLELKFNSKNTN